MSPSPPPLRPSPHPQSPYSRTAVIAAVHDFYALLIKLPYIPPESLIHAPPQGWPGVPAEILRRKGKTEEVIALLAHLPYLRAPAPGKKWMLGPDTIAIAYCDGEVCDEVLESIQPVPGHCVWLADIDGRDGTGVLLDTETGTVTEWTPMERKLMVEYEAYERIPARDRWMAHATMPAVAFFGRWKRRFERLVWMAVYDARGSAGTAQWYFSATTPEEEEDMLASDDEFDPVTDGYGELEEGESESDGEDDMDVEDGEISKEEADGLMEDAYGEEAHQRRMELLSQENTAGHQSVGMPASELAEQFQPLLGSLERKTKEVYDIYTRNGWPSNFNREKCRMNLAGFLEREEPPSN